MGGGGPGGGGPGGDACVGGTQAAVYIAPVIVPVKKLRPPASSMLPMVMRTLDPAGVGVGHTELPLYVI